MSLIGSNQRDQPLRVVQWTTGIVGASSLRAIIEDPRLELVGVFAHSDAKIGEDAGVIAGVGPVGVRATGEVDALIGLEPDCIVYMPQWPDIAMLECFLGAGINVVTTARLVTGRYYDDDAGQRLERAARRGGASLYGTGMNPMFVPTVALAATAMCRHVHHIRVIESVDCALYGAAATWEAYGFGSPIDRPDLKDDLWRAEPDYREVLDVMARSLGVELDDMTLDVDYAAANEDRDLGFMKISEGTVAALDARWIGLVGGKPFVELRTVWKLAAMFGFTEDPDWPMLYGYRVEIDGEPTVRLKLSFRPEDLDNIDIGCSTALPAVNAIPAVCAARPGVITPAELTLITGRGSPIGLA